MKQRAQNVPRGDMDDVFCYTKTGFISVLCFIRKNVTGIIFMNKADPDTACKQKGGKVPCQRKAPSGF